jgi:hypothetical protein
MTRELRRLAEELYPLLVAKMGNLAPPTVSIKSGVRDLPTPLTFDPDGGMRFQQGLTDPHMITWMDEEVTVARLFGTRAFGAVYTSRLSLGVEGGETAGEVSYVDLSAWAGNPFGAAQVVASGTYGDATASYVRFLIGGAQKFNCDYLGNVQIEGDLTHYGTQRQGAYTKRWTAYKTNIADNTATSMFRVTTTDETGNADGGGYAVFVRALVGHALVNNTGGAAAGAYTFAFSRALLGAGTGANSVITAVAPAGTATTSAPARDIASVTASLVETSEYQNDFRLTIDLSGSSVSTANVVLEVTLLWYGFSTAPVLSAL